MIEKGIPFSDGRSLIKRKCKYPWRDMEVGDSFLVTHVGQKAMAVTAKYHARKTGWRFRASTVENGVRVWRIA